MHMADALISPAVGGVMWAVTAGTLAYSAKKLNDENIFETKKMPLMGVMGAFVFAAQMINFTIPATGSSGHLGGGLLLASLLGPHAGFIVISIVLAIQALFFADGGLLAMGCNIFNMGFLACFLAYPFIFKPIISKGLTKRNIIFASVSGAIASLLAGSFCVVLQTTLSGITDLPFGTFSALMIPIHLAIGAVEGLVTAAVIVFVHKEQPSIFDNSAPKKSLKTAAVSLIIVTIVCGGIISWFASSHPDGLEWSIYNIIGENELTADYSAHETADKIQQSTSFMPDYNFKNAEEVDSVVNLGGSVAGIVGSGIVLLLSCGAGYLVSLFSKKSST